ncbi:nucleotide-diphospho-sugar transferase [Limimaricola soesokkakensis]|uniref:Nucleotide-diphospho-sugar transferase n=1 Tax=Limimaricola soesokkakensis TaxID=1343159 RepID=A0A1X6ZJG8_9RHOB|nr:putative nucleotide-diphospho-sugar transferase [Limimaricola soesokkakensis]PSK84923.1 nucleotide-diphospho-sugar transferase [Limimaricola soesokkakensis]SLN52989.1 Nucleotide-diphospho-sugar transferase [Limimaricola soesokkakensis]
MTDQDLDRGFVFAVTGKDYVTLARRAARNLRGVMPSVKIDLFTDAPLEDEVFDRVHLLEQVSRRPKMESLQRSRFARTIYLDADIVTLAPLDDVFDILDRFDIAVTASQRRNDYRNREQYPGHPVPPAFPQMNGGVMAIRRNAATDRFLEDWHAMVHDGTQKFDQPALRVLLYEGDLRLHVLPVEYNVMFFRPFMLNGNGYTAPRLLHEPKLHQKPAGDPLRPFSPDEVLAPPQVAKLAEFLDNDQTLTHYAPVTGGAPVAPTPHRTGWRSFLGNLKRRVI